MKPRVNGLALPGAALLVALSAPLPAAAQVQNAIDRDLGRPAGIALPVAGAAAAEEPSALEVNPAGIGFVPRLALQWFHEQAVTPGSRGDGLWSASGVGPLGVGFAMQWLRPGGDTPRYRKTTFALASTDTRTLSLAVAWNRWASPDVALDQLASWDVGITYRPSRRLSLAAVMRDRDARLGGLRLPVRYDLGLATRLWRDALTLSADLLADDLARDDFRLTHAAAGAAFELRFGLALALQVAVPLQSEIEGPNGASAVVALSWNGPHGGWTGGVTPLRDRTGWFVGARVSSERYRSAATGHDAPLVDLEDALRGPRRIVFLSFGDPDPYGSLLLRLEALRDDPEVAVLVVRIEGLPVSAGRAAELRGALERFRERKPVLAYLSGGGTTEYWLATGATAVAAAPGALVVVNGLSTSRLFLRDALARLGVGVEVVKRGAYKTAPEPLVRSDSSPEAREVANALLDDVFGRIVSDVAGARKLAETKVRALVDEGLFSAEDAKAEGLIDEVLWPDEVEEWARRATGRRVKVARKYALDPERRAQRWGPSSAVEIIRVEGTLARGKSRGDRLGVDAIAGAETIGAQLRRAASDRKVKAIVLRIESPGGDGTASDLVWREVVRARRRKPVIASMGDLAASGGYLVAAGADVILAEPSTLTGSIGVFALKPEVSGLLRKLSVGREAFTRGENAQLTSLAKPWTASERAAVERQIERFYLLFLDRVAEGRRLSREDVEGVAAGRVWTGRQALERRLVDRLGSLQDAIALARERARLGPDDLVEVRRARREDGGPLALFEAAARTLAPEPPLAHLVSLVPELRALAVLSELGPVLALPVEWVTPEAD